MVKMVLHITTTEVVKVFLNFDKNCKTNRTYIYEPQAFKARIAIKGEYL